MTIDANHLRIKDGGGLAVEGDELKVVAYVGSKISGTTSVAHNTGTYLSMGTVDFDDDSMTVTPHRITFNTAGRYLVGSQVTWTVNAGGRREINLIVNRSVSIASSDRQGSTMGGNARMNIASIYEFNEGDYIEVYSYHYASNNLDAVANMWAQKIA
jgi:hypothetical protein